MSGNAQIERTFFVPPRLLWRVRAAARSRLLVVVLTTAVMIAAAALPAAADSHTATPVATGDGAWATARAALGGTLVALEAAERTHAEAAGAAALAATGLESARAELTRRQAQPATDVAPQGFLAVVQQHAVVSAAKKRAVAANAALRAAEAGLDRARVEAEASRTAALTWPAEGVLTSEFGSRVHPLTGVSRHHSGIDISAPPGHPVLAAAAGRVGFAGWQNGYGMTIELDHGEGWTTLYAHLSGIGVVEGQSLAAGEEIGAVGSTGASSGPHLHFEVRQDGAAQDPLALLPAR
jgi:murein DD-endopeptidase MepM/ murein hydrolase activator NlpD